MTIPNRFQTRSNQVEDLAYELYKFDWKQQNHITLEDEKALAASYYRYINKKPMAQESFEEFIDMVGFPGGKSYKSKEEFLQTEMKSFEYLQYLLPTEMLEAIKSFQEFEQTNEEFILD